MNQKESIAFQDPPERNRLEPFATIFLEIIVPEAERGGWFGSGETPRGKELERISRRIATRIQAQFGHVLHAALWVHALLVCAHYFYQSATALDDPQEEERQTAAVDAGYSLIQSLKLYHDLHGLYLRIS